MNYPGSSATLDHIEYTNTSFRVYSNWCKCLRYVIRQVQYSSCIRSSRKDVRHAFPPTKEKADANFAKIRTSSQQVVPTTMHGISSVRRRMNSYSYTPVKAEQKPSTAPVSQLSSLFRWITRKTVLPTIASTRVADVPYLPLTVAGPMPHLERYISSTLWTRVGGQVF